MTGPAAGAFAEIDGASRRHAYCASASTTDLRTQPALHPRVPLTWPPPPRPLRQSATRASAPADAHHGGSPTSPACAAAAPAANPADAAIGGWRHRDDRYRARSNRWEGAGG